MKLKRLWIDGFQSFATSSATEILFADATFFIGPNGAGKTAVLAALCRMFSYNSTLKQILPSDFYIPLNEPAANQDTERQFWIEADFEFPELADDDDDSFSIPTNFAHMRLQSGDDIPTVRFRLEATLDVDNEVESTFNYVLEVDKHDEPLKTAPVPKQDRNAIHIHYLPARRNPSDHVTYATSSLVGRLLRAANWQDARENIAQLTDQISDTLGDNASIVCINEHLKKQWKNLHKGPFFTEANISFGNSDIESLLRHLSVSFSPGHDQLPVDYSRLSDGQKSLLYLSLVLAAHEVGQDVLSAKSDAFDINKLRPPVFTLVAMEEPENSLSSHFLGRIIRTLTEFATQTDTQVAIATHSPSLLRRVAPEAIRYLRLDENRQTQVNTITMPAEKDEAYKFVRNAVQAYPELYFSRLVILGEGDSENIVLSRLLQAMGMEYDDSAISIVPLGGRHVNHFWRLLHSLDIPHLTLLDLDLCRYQGGWGRVRNVVTQLIKFTPRRKKRLNKRLRERLATIPKWADPSAVLDDGQMHIRYLERCDVFFSSPLDLDFSMMRSFPVAYDIDEEAPDDKVIVSVLGKSYQHIEQYTTDEQAYFSDYHRLFKLGSKPAEHLTALAGLDDQELIDNVDEVYKRLFDAVKRKLEELPE